MLQQTSEIRIVLREQSIVVKAKLRLTLCSFLFLQTAIIQTFIFNV